MLKYFIGQKDLYICVSKYKNIFEGNLKLDRSGHSSACCSIRECCFSLSEGKLSCH